MLKILQLRAVHLLHHQSVMMTSPVILLNHAVPIKGDDSSDSLNDSIPPLPPPMPLLHVSSKMLVQFPPQFKMCVSS